MQRLEARLLEMDRRVGMGMGDRKGGAWNVWPWVWVWVGV